VGFLANLLRSMRSDSDSYKNSPSYKHFVSFKEGDKVKYMGNDAIVLSTYGEDFWDDDSNDIPTLYLAYTDKTGRVHRDHLYPHDVLCLVTAMEK
jgi:hypothetical protein